MKSPLEILVGLTITNLMELHDYVQLHFGNDVGVSIYNKTVASPAIPRIKFIGKTMKSVTSDERSITFDFSDGSQLVIDMRPEAYRGPEALELNRLGYPPVIWN